MLLLSVLSPPWAWLRCARGEPLLEVMYLKYDQQPIDTVPTFNPMISEYKATLDWKMKYFAVEARTVGDAVIDNIHLCPQAADCLKQDEHVVRMDFSSNILVQPGGKVLFMFDILEQGVVRSYTVIVNRLEGTETYVRHIIMQGATLVPAFRSTSSSYRCMLDVTMEFARLELHLADGSQTVYASAEQPVLLSDQDTITMLRNTHPGGTRAPPTRLRRLREEAFGEFQFPNKYADFPIPLGSKRMINFEVVSADAGHRGYYQLELARRSCGPAAPIFDAIARVCVRFCDTGFWADYASWRCKRCPDHCQGCVSPHHCLRCSRPDKKFDYVLNNATGECHAVARNLWERHRQYLFAAAAASACFSIFICGLVAFYCAGGFSSSSRNPRLPLQSSFSSHRLVQANMKRDRGALSALEASRGQYAGYSKVGDVDADDD